MDKDIMAYKKIGGNLRSFKKNLGEFLSKQKHVKLVYFFGLVAKENEGSLSDIDIAVFIDESFNKKERFKLQLKLRLGLTNIMKTDKINLIVMNDAPLLLKYNIIKYGKILKDDIETKIRVESGILSNYLDMKYYIDRHTNLAIKRIAKRGLL